MLPKEPDRRKTYWKATNNKENHLGLQYRTGLIIDPKPFNNDPNKSCIPGGIYFTTKKYIHRFFWIGTNLRSVKIPKDAKVILDPEGDKYRADKIIVGKKRNLDYYFDHLFDKSTFPINEYKYLMIYCQEYFNKWFDKKTHPIDEYKYLAIYCPNYFDKWFDKETFPKKDYWSLAEYCQEHFDKWFDKETFPKKDYWRLVEHCSKHFNKWFDEKIFPNDEYHLIIKYCSKYIDK